jgi:hypothetical protein
VPANHRRFAYAVIASLVVLAACSGDGEDDYRFADSELAATVTEGVLSAVIPPEGGVVVGPADTEFEGVRVDLPPGALPSGTIFTISPGTEGAPLPDFAERVGAQFTFGPADAPLAEPVEVTLPVRPETLVPLASGADDVKVWVRAGDTWRLQDAAASSESSVTLALDALSTAAAGVKIVAVTLPSCALCASACPLNGPCIEDLGTLPVPPSPATFSGYRFASDGSALAYVGTQSGADVGVRIHLPAVGFASGTLGASVSLPAVGTSACCLTAPLLDTDGSLRVGRTFEHGGFPRFRFGNTTQLEATNVDGKPVGLVRTGAGAVARVTRHGVVGPSGAFESFPLVRRIETFSQLAPAFTDEAAFIAISNVAQTRFRRYTFDGETDLGIDTPGFQQCFSRLTSDEFGVGGTLAACASLKATLSGVAQTITECRFSGFAECSTIFESQTIRFFALDYEASDGLWLTSYNTPEVFHYDKDRVLTSHNLQTALPNLPLAQLIPRDVVALNIDAAIVVTSANRVIRVHRD